MLVIAALSILAIAVGIPLTASGAAIFINPEDRRIGRVLLVAGGFPLLLGAWLLTILFNLP